jgi:DNA ligase D-like protein (predicted 3'-phosphoesterase)
MVTLRKYHAKRAAGHSPEPRGRSTRSRRRSAPHFVIQHHAASTDHYDFRLEIDGVLASWAVPKGPSINPKEKRMARRTEDHPMEYEDFEGIIPEGEYGADASSSGIAERTQTKATTAWPTPLTWPSVNQAARRETARWVRAHPVSHR